MPRNWWVGVEEGDNVTWTCKHSGCYATNKSGKDGIVNERTFHLPSSEKKLEKSAVEHDPPWTEIPQQKNFWLCHIRVPENRGKMWWWNDEGGHQVMAGVAITKRSTNLVPPL